MKPRRNRHPQHRRSIERDGPAIFIKDRTKRALKPWPAHIRFTDDPRSLAPDVGPQPNRDLAYSPNPAVCEW